MRVLSANEIACVSGGTVLNDQAEDILVQARMPSGFSAANWEWMLRNNPTWAASYGQTFMQSEWYKNQASKIPASQDSDGDGISDANDPDPLFPEEIVVTGERNESFVGFSNLVQTYWPALVGGIGGSALRQILIRIGVSADAALTAAPFGGTALATLAKEVDQQIGDAAYGFANFYGPRAGESLSGGGLIYYP